MYPQWVGSEGRDCRCLSDARSVVLRIYCTHGEKGFGFVCLKMLQSDDDDNVI